MNAAAFFCAVSMLALLGSGAYLWHFLDELPPKRRALNLLYPLSQLLVVGFLLATSLRYKLAAAAIMGTVLALAFVVLDPILFKSLLAAERAGREAELVRLLKGQVKAQQEHACLMAISANNAQELRGRFCKQVAHIEQALANGDAPAAKAQLAIAEDVISSSATRYCQHPAADALLGAKASRCEECGIDLKLNARIPRDLPLPSVELCAILANALDNAMNACLIFKSKQNRWIHLSANVTNGAFLIKVENPDPKREGQKAKVSTTGTPEHGWGLSIVEEIARRHGGDLRVDKTNDVFTFSVVLLLNEGRP